MVRNGLWSLLTHHQSQRGEVMRVDTYEIENKYGTFVKLLIFWGDTIAMLVLPIWAGISYATDTNYHSGTDIFGGIVVTVVVFVAYIIFSGILWKALIFLLAIPLGLMKLIRGDFSE